MKNAKRILAAALSLSLAVSLAACGGSSGGNSASSAPAEGAASTAGSEAATPAAEPTYVWSWGTVDSTSNPNYEAQLYFIDLLNEKAPGKWDITVYPDSQLGDAAQMVESVQMGTLEMANPASSFVANYVPEYGVFDMPYLFTSTEEVDTVLDGEIGQDLAALADSANLKLVAWWEVGFRCLANNARPINSVDDIPGLRLRIMSSEVHSALWTTLGADPVPMSLSDAYVANQNGTIDGQDNPLHSLIANSTYEVCHYVAVTNHIYSPLAMIMSTDAWNSMTEEDRAIFNECLVEATAKQKELVREQSEKAADELVELGCEVTYPDLAPFAEKMQPVYDQYPQYADIIARIREAIA